MLLAIDPGPAQSAWVEYWNGAVFGCGIVENDAILDRLRPLDAELEAMLAAKQIAGYWYEPVKLKLADKTYYSPDFLVLHLDGSLECREVKGHWEDDARVKIKVAASKFWFLTFAAYKPLAKKRGGGWDVETFN